MKPNLLSYQTAQEYIQLFCQKYSETWPSEIVPCTSILNRVLAHDIVAKDYQPSCDISAMDGYAIRYEDFEPRKKFNLIGESAAGASRIPSIVPNSAIRIFTGGHVPQGADTVIMQEQIDNKSENYVSFIGNVQKGDNIRVKGNEYQPGDIIIKSGTVLNEYHSALFAHANKFSVMVKQKPSIAIIQTGSELAEPFQNESTYQITATNAIILQALIEKTGGVANYLGTVKDTLSEITKKISTATTHIIITTGGVSIGDYDLVEQALLPLGFKRIFWKVSIKPGKPILFGHIGDTLFFGLPGNPVSSVVCFDQFVKPAMQTLLKAQPAPNRFQAQITNDIKMNQRKTFLLGQYHYHGKEKPLATPLPTQNSGNITLFSTANCYIIIPEGDETISAGSLVEIQLL